MITGALLFGFMVSSKPVISGSDVVGSVLTVTPGSGTIQWKRNGVDIGGETASTYTSVAADSYDGVEITCEVNGILSDPFLVVVDPSTIGRYYTATNAYKDTAHTIPPVNNEGVQSVLDTAGVIDLDFIGTIVGKVQLQGLDTYGDTDPYPRWYNTDGDFIHIANSYAQKFETQVASLGISGEFCIVVFIQPNGGTDNEYFFFVSNGAGLRDRDAGTGNTTQIGSFNSLVSLASGGRFLLSNVYKKTMVVIHRLATGVAQLYVNGVAWGPTANIGTNNMNEHAIGSNAHNANLNWYKSILISGVYDAVQMGQLKKEFEKNNGALGSYYNEFPVVTFDSGGTYNDQETYDGTTITAPAYNFRSPFSIPEGATEVRLYNSNSSSQATAIENRTYVMTKTKGIDADYTEFVRNVDFFTLNVWYWMEFRGVDTDGTMQIIPTQTQGLLIS